MIRGTTNLIAHLGYPTDSFDGEGFVRGVLRKGRNSKGARVLVVGSGGGTLPSWPLPTTSADKRACLRGVRRTHAAGL